VLFIVFVSFYLGPLMAQEKNGNIVSLEKLADSLYYDLSNQYSDKNYIKALDLRNAVLLKYTDTTSSKYKTSLAKKHASKAIYLAYKQQYDSAIVSSKNALKIIESLKKQNLFLKGYVYMRLYEQVARNGDWKTAYELTKKTHQIFKDTLVGNHKLIADVAFDIGYVATTFGDYDTQLKQYIIAKDMYISFMGENNHDVALKYHHLATVYGNMGYYKKELESYKNSAKIWEAINFEDKSYLNISYGSLFSWYLQHGDYKKAEQYLVKGEKLINDYKGEKWFNETFKGRTEINTWRNYAELYQHKNNTTKALFYSNKILDYLNNLDVNDKRTNPNNVPYMKNWVNDRKEIGLLFKAGLLKKEYPQKAIYIYEQLLILKEEENNKSTLTERINLIQYYSNNKDYNKAQINLDKGLLEAIKRKNDYEIIQLIAEQANLYIVQDDVLEMHEKYKQVFKKIQKDSLQKIAFQSLKYKNCKPFGNKAFVNLILRASSNYKKAYAKTERESYLKIAQNLNVLVSELFAVNYASLNYNDKTYTTVIKINEQLLGTALLLKDEVVFDKVLQKIEESSSRLSWKNFLTSNQRKHINIPDSILKKEEGLNAQLHFYKKTLFTSKESNKEKVRLWKEKIFDLEKELELLNVWYQKNYTSYFNQTQKTFDLGFLKTKLKKEQKIIKYIFAEENVYAFTVSKNTTQLYLIGDKINVSNRLKPLIQLLSKSSNNDFKSQGQEAYKLLLPPQVLDTKNEQELIFILDDILHYLPLEILVDANGKYLIEKHAISYAPSLLLWNEQLQVKKSKNNKLGVFSPIYKTKTTNNPKRDEGSQLLGANREAEEIAKLFNSDIFSGNKQEFIKNAKAYNILHLAMHSAINNTDSEFSHLAFPTGQEDNKLFISELYNMSLNADLAVLSACNTAVGNLEKGEGLINVSRAFTYAGVPSTVTSLWKVPDKETSQIMISFYEYLKKGKSKNTALQLAKLDYLSSTDDVVLKHPYYWAGFILSGDISSIMSPTPYGKYALWGSLVLILGAYFFRKKR